MDKFVSLLVHELEGGKYVVSWTSGGSRVGAEFGDEQSAMKFYDAFRKGELEWCKVEGSP